MRTALVSTFLALAIGVGPALAQSPDEAAIKKLSDAYAAAIDRGDAKAVAALHTEDAVRANGQTISVGRANIEKQLTEQYASRPKDQTVKITIHSAKLVTPDVAVVHGGYEVSTGGKGHFIRTLVKKDGQWLIAAIQIAPAPAATS